VGSTPSFTRRGLLFLSFSESSLSEMISEAPRLSFQEPLTLEMTPPPERYPVVKDGGLAIESDAWGDSKLPPRLPEKERRRSPRRPDGGNAA